MHNLTRLIFAAALAALPTTALAEPITLKLSFLTSDRSLMYEYDVKPFVDAVNAENPDLLRIDIYFSSVLGPITEQPKLVADGAVDMALIIPSYTPELFPDTALFELAGLFQNDYEATHIYTRLANTGALADYKDYFVIGARVTEPESIHSRLPINSLADLNQQPIRTNNEIEMTTLRKFGAVPLMLPINAATDALAEGKITGVTATLAMLPEFGFGRVTKYHYMIRLGGVPVAIVMNRKKFDALPSAAQDIIKKYSGDWIAQRTVASFDAKNREVLAQLESDPRRKVVFPSAKDLQTIQRIFNNEIDDWASARPRNQSLLALARAEIARYREGKR